MNKEWRKSPNCLGLPKEASSGLVLALNRGRGTEEYVLRARVNIFSTEIVVPLNDSLATMTFFDLSLGFGQNLFSCCRIREKKTTLICFFIGIFCVWFLKNTNFWCLQTARFYPNCLIFIFRQRFFCFAFSLKN